MPKDHTPAHDAEEGASHKAGAFDIRMFIGALIGLYGIVLVITGTRLHPTAGPSTSTTGVCMLIGAASSSSGPGCARWSCRRSRRRRSRLLPPTEPALAPARGSGSVEPLSAAAKTPV